MPGHFNHDIISALNNAAVKLFWEKKDLRRMLNIAGVDTALIAAQDWTAYKYHILGPIIAHLNLTNEGIGPLRRILHETLLYKDAKHLLRYTDGRDRRRDAEEALATLRALVEAHNEARATAEDEAESPRLRVEESQKQTRFNERLEQLKADYMRLVGSSDEHARGIALEAHLNDLFLLFELAPHSSFRRKGEQIDGSFLMNGENYLVEAKWTAHSSNLADLRDLDGAVGSSLDNTLGLFISINGFTPRGPSRIRAGKQTTLVLYGWRGPLSSSGSKDRSHRDAVSKEGLSGSTKKNFRQGGRHNLREYLSVMAVSVAAIRATCRH